MNNFRLLESFGLHEGNYIVLEKHLERLAASASTFNFSLPLEKIRSSLNSIRIKHSAGSWKIRLLVSAKGECEWDIANINPISHNVKIGLSTGPISSENVFLYHKTTNRHIYETNKITSNGIFDTLLWNERDEITEFTIGNVVCEFDKELYTPPVSCGLLNGTFRRHLIDAGTIQERVIAKEELNEVSRIWLINSVRKWLPAEIVY